MVVIAIIGLLAAIALPKFGDVASQAKVANVQGNLSSLRTSIAMFYSQDGSYPDLASHETALSGAVGTDSTGTAIDFTDYYNKSVMPDTPAGQVVGATTATTFEAKNTTTAVASDTAAATAATSGTGGWNYITTDGTITASLPANAYVTGSNLADF
jgi:type IV pilus assembly protein PilA